MWPRLHCTLATLAFCVTPLCMGRQTGPCFPADQAAQMLKKDICVSAHIYEVVQLPDGTRFLDVCSPQTPDDQCRFTVISLPEDRERSRRAQQIPRHGRTDSRHRPAHARPRRNGSEPRPPVLRRAAQIQAQPPARPRLQRRAGAARPLATRTCAPRAVAAPS